MRESLSRSLARLRNLKSPRQSLRARVDPGLAAPSRQRREHAPWGQWNLRQLDTQRVGDRTTVAFTSTATLTAEALSRRYTGQEGG